MDYRRAITVDRPFDEVQDEVRTALANQGFGIVSEIDMANTLRTKIGAEIEPLIILGACNPGLAYRAVQAEPSVGVLLPCNVVVRGTGSMTIVEAQDPRMLSAMTGNPDLEDLSREVSALLDAALSEVASGTAVLPA